MFLSCYGETTSQLFRNDFDYNYTLMYGFLGALIQIAISSIIMMAIPFLCKIPQKGALPYKSGKVICLWNSIILFIFSCFLMTIVNISFVGLLQAIFFYFINKWIFVEQPSPSQEDTEIYKPICEIDSTDTTNQNSNFVINKISPEKSAHYITDDQSEQKCVPNNEQPKYCCQCGSKLDQDTKKCPGCGR